MILVKVALNRCSHWWLKVWAMEQHFCIWCLIQLLPLTQNPIKAQRPPLLMNRQAPRFPQTTSELLLTKKTQLHQQNLKALKRVTSGAEGMRAAAPVPPQPQRREGTYSVPGLSGWRSWLQTGEWETGRGVINVKPRKATEKKTEPNE